jgi:hypothetical protein
MLGALPAYAQDAPKVEGTLGYQAINARTGKAENGENAWYSIGFNIDGSWSLNPTWSILGELGWGRSPVEGTCTVCSSPIPLHEQTRAAFNETNMGGGVRYNKRGMGKLTPFAQIVVGFPATRSTPARRSSLQSSSARRIPPTPSWRSRVAASSTK